MDAAIKGRGTPGEMHNCFLCPKHCRKAQCPAFLSSHLSETHFNYVGDLGCALDGAWP